MNVLNELDALERQEKQTAKVTYAKLCRRLAGGEDVPPQEARNILKAADKTTAELREETTRLKSILDKQAAAQPLLDAGDRSRAMRVKNDKIRAEIEQRAKDDAERLEAMNTEEAVIRNQATKRDQLAEEVWQLATPDERLTWGSRDAAIGLVRQ